MNPKTDMSYVLIVDDDADLCAFMVQLLSRSGIETRCARNGNEALACMRDRTPCLVFLDLRMPVMDGWDFRATQLLDPELAAVPVVVVTAYFERSDVEQRLGLPCLRKPLEAEDVLAQVQRTCSGSVTNGDDG